MRRYFEDYTLGERFESAAFAVTERGIADFMVYDPQIYHRAETAGSTRFGRLIASGWQTAAIAMRLMCDTIFGEVGAIGLGVEDLRWPRPVYPGDELRILAEVIGLKATPGKPGGVVKLAVGVLNAQGDVVMTERVAALIDRRPEAQP